MGGENNPLEVRERRKQAENAADAAPPPLLSHKDPGVLLAMRDQARLVSTAIQLLTSPESSCLHAPPLCHKACCGEAAEPDDLDKPRSQVRRPPRGVT